jgi:hypothetical protein
MARAITVVRLADPFQRVPGADSDLGWFHLRFVTIKVYGSGFWKVL